jgi:hypothetical protein
VLVVAVSAVSAHLFYWHTHGRSVKQTASPGMTLVAYKGERGLAMGNLLVSGSGRGHLLLAKTYAAINREGLPRRKKQTVKRFTFLQKWSNHQND